MNSGEPPSGPPGLTNLADPFPREAVRDLVQQSERARERRERIQAWFMGLGLTAVLIGLPCSLLWGSMDLVHHVAGTGERAYGILALLTRLVSWATGASAEGATFFVSALCLGLTLPTLRALLRSIGFPQGLSITCATIATLAPGLWLASSMPLGFSASVLGASFLALQLFRLEQNKPNGYQWRATMALFLAFLLGLKTCCSSPRWPGPSAPTPAPRGPRASSPPSPLAS